MILRLLRIRKVNDEWENDSINLFNWRNDEITRKNSFNTEIIKWEEHKKWFKSVLNNPLRDLYILSDDSVPIGTIRFDKNEKLNCAEISITISPRNRRKGYGVEAIKKFSLIYLKENNLNYIFAEIKPDNLISIDTFINAGYKFYKEFSDKLVYRFDIKENKNNDK